MQLINRETRKDDVLRILAQSVHELEAARTASDEAHDRLRGAIREARAFHEHFDGPTLRPVDIARAVGSPANYVNGLWSRLGYTGDVNDPRWFSRAERDDPERMKKALARYSQETEKMAVIEESALNTRNELIVAAYTHTKVGVSAIAEAVAINRNHVLKLAKTAGVRRRRPGPYHNQHTDEG